MGKRLYDTWEDLIAAKTHREGDCLIWDAGCHSQGYPMARWGNKMVKIDRTQCELKVGRTFDRSTRVKNQCGNIKCVNPDHYLITEYGEETWKCWSFKYNDEQRADIQRLYAEYINSKTGTKYGAYKHIQTIYKGISKTTLIDIIKNSS